MILQSLAGLPAFIVYFCTGLVAITLFLFVYTRITPHDEFKLIRENVPGAAISLGFSLLGFVFTSGQRHHPFRQRLRLPDLERDCPDRSGYRLFRGPDSRPQFVT